MLYCMQYYNNEAILTLHLCVYKLMLCDWESQALDERNDYCFGEPHYNIYHLGNITNELCWVAAEK